MGETLTKESSVNKPTSWPTAVLVVVLTFSAIMFGQANTAAAAAPQAVTTATPGAAASTTTQPACDPKRSMQVTGSALVNVAPDRALIQLGVQSNASTVRLVEQINSTSTQAVIKAIRSLGIDAQDIATDVYMIEPIYEDYDSLYIKGYRIHNVVAVTVRDVSLTSHLIAVALQAGANQVVGVDFYTSQLRKYRDQAREMAMQAAREKAQALAQAAGAKAECVLTINENSWSYYTGWWSGRNQSQNVWTQNALQNAAPAPGSSTTSGDEPISLGKISIKAEISATFTLK